MVRDQDGTPEVDARDRDPGSRMPYYISAAVLAFPIVVLAMQMVLVHTVR